MNKAKEILRIFEQEVPKMGEIMKKLEDILRFLRLIERESGLDLEREVAAASKAIDNIRYRIVSPRKK